MTATAHERALDRGGLAPAYAAARTRLGLIALLLALAAVGWWWTAREMQDMDGGPWTELGTVAWFLGVWVVMMAAMMFPSVAPTVALYSKLKHTRALGAPLTIHLRVPPRVERRRAPGLRARQDRGTALRRRARVGQRGALGRWRHALRGCGVRADPPQGRLPRKVSFAARIPSRQLARGLSGAMQMGARHGAWCVGCCWALMASLFALGVMSVVWMAVVAGLIAFEKLISSRRVATYGTATLSSFSGCSCSSLRTSSRR